MYGVAVKKYESMVKELSEEKMKRCVKQQKEDEHTRKDLGQNGGLEC